MVNVVHVMVKVHGQYIEFEAHWGMEADATFASRRQNLEANSGMILPYWNDCTAFQVDYTETMFDLLKRSKEFDDDYNGIVNIDAFEFNQLAGIPLDFADFNDSMMDAATYMEVMQGLPPPQRQHQKIKVFCERIVGSGPRLLAETIDTGVTMSYLWMKFADGIPRHLLQLVDHGRPLPIKGPILLPMRRNKS